MTNSHQSGRPTLKTIPSSLGWVIVRGSERQLLSPHTYEAL